MKGMIFTLSFKPRFALDLSPLIPERLQSMTQAEIKRIQLDYGKSKLAVEKAFKIKSAKNDNIEFRRSTDKLIRIGRDMSEGTIIIKGDAGDYVGQSMKGGTIIVNGNVGSWMGCAMSEGYIVVNGNVGDYLGGALAGEIEGMTDGFICIYGNAGNCIGDRMRRGMIIIEGSAGNYCGSRMHAGTIIVLDKAGEHVGFSMRRGTIVLAKRPRHIAATFRSCGNLKMQFLRLLFKQIADMGKQYDIFKKIDPEVHRYAGDLAYKGKGEILILQPILESIKPGTKSA